MVHEEGWTVEAQPGESPAFTSPEGRVIRRAVAPPPRLPEVAVDELIAAHVARGIEPTWRAGLSEWRYDHLMDEHLRARAWEALDAPGCQG